VVDREEHPVAFASRQLKKPEVNYTTTEKELLAITWAVGHFRCYIYGRKFTIFTDHAALTWLFGLKDPSSRLMRWTLKLGEYDYKVIHKPGRSHANADALSRKIRQVSSEEVINFGMEQDQDPECVKWKGMQGFVVAGSVLCKKTTMGNKVVVPRSCREKVLRQCHDHILSGHLGVQATESRLKKDYWWPSCSGDVRKYVKGCIACSQRSPYGRCRAPLQALPAAKRPFEFIAIDIVGPLPKTDEGYRYILSILDHFTRYLVMVPLTDQTAESVSVALVKQWILKFGVPELLLTDQGTNFMSELFRQVCELLKINRLRTSPFHPECNGRLERVHRTIAQMLSHYVNMRNNDWERHLAFAVAAYNTSKHRSTGFTPHELVFGRQMVSPFQCTGVSVSEKEHPGVTGLRERLKGMWKRCAHNNRLVEEKRRETVKGRGKLWEYKEGDFVFLSDPCMKVGQVKKFHRPWKGPYRVLKVVSKCNLLLELPFRTLLIHRNRVKPYFGPIPPPSLGTAERRPGRPRKEQTTPPSRAPAHAAGPSEWECEEVGVSVPAVDGELSDDGWGTAEGESSCDSEPSYIPPPQVHQLPADRSPYSLRSAERSVDPPYSPPAETTEEASDPLPSSLPAHGSPLRRSPYFLRSRTAKPSEEEL
jgi:transposase InsO family protein